MRCVSLANLFSTTTHMHISRFTLVQVMSSSRKNHSRGNNKHQRDKNLIVPCTILVPLPKPSPSASFSLEVPDKNNPYPNTPQEPARYSNLPTKQEHVERADYDKQEQDQDHFTKSKVQKKDVDLDTRIETMEDSFALQMNNICNSFKDRFDTFQQQQNINIKEKVHIFNKILSSSTKKN